MVNFLNLLWLFLGAGALTVLGIVELRRSSAMAGGWRTRAIAVALVMVCLFPSISASDDLIGFAYIDSGLETRSGLGHSAPESSTDTSAVLLVRMLESFEHLQVIPIFSLALTFCFFGIVFLPRALSCVRQLPCLVSRGPPSL